MRSRDGLVPGGGFVSVVRENVAAYGDQRSFTFVTEERGPGRTYKETVLGFAELDRSARALAARLQAYDLQDRAVMLLYPEGLEFVTAFLACLYARVLAVPAPLPELDAGRSGRTRRIIADADIRWVLTDRAHRGKLDKWLADAGLADHVGCLDTETDMGADPRDWSTPLIGPDTLAFLQYTSGSTSEPKGVMVSHGNLLYNAEEIKQAIRGCPDTVGTGWVPHYHDMGLVGQFLQPLYMGCRYVFTSPITFIKRPVLWLELATRHHATIMLAPNFGYELCLRRVTDQQLEGLDLRSLRTAKNGAEPVRAATMERMVERFGPVGFRPDVWMPCYGMAETTLLIAGASFGGGAVVRDFDADALTRNQAIPVDAPPAEAAAAERGERRSPDDRPAPDGSAEPGVRRSPDDRSAAEGSAERSVRRLVGNGSPVTLDVRIVDPETGVVQPAGRVGEIWVRGGNVAQGYWRRPEQTRETFHAFTADGAGPYLRTGDLGFVADGELYVTGRIKDLIIVNGRNIHAHDLEEAAQAANPKARNTAAFAIDTGTEQVVIVQEVGTAPGGEIPLSELAARTKARVARAFDLPELGVVLAARGAVRRTTSGKIQRGRTRQALLDGKINCLSADLQPDVSKQISQKRD
ncbi:fatty acyl-AMP ligase [Spirillospora sp. NPDC048911]|uniref:fatty acyl-AMP ligase n=1 Tax=Spirillospora sp. NPDC048911 TaxID=3364527 RepID=UPI003712CFE3